VVAVVVMTALKEQALVVLVVIELLPDFLFQLELVTQLPLAPVVQEELLLLVIRETIVCLALLLQLVAALVHSHYLQAEAVAPVVEERVGKPVGLEQQAKVTTVVGPAQRAMAVVAVVQAPQVGQVVVLLVETVVMVLPLQLPAHL
jgi:hypothetical protein